MGKAQKKVKMNLILKAINTEKTIYRQFPATFYEEAVVIFEFTPELSNFLPSLVKGITNYTNEEIDVYCTSAEMFSEIVDIKKIKRLEDGKVELIEPKTLNLTEIVNPV